MSQYIQKEDAQKIVDLAAPGELIPVTAFLSFGKVIDADVEWAKKLNKLKD